MYQLFEVDAGKVQITPEFIAHESTLIHSQLAFQALFYSCLWAVKVSFLIFFLFFLIITIYLIKAGKTYFDEVSQIPLDTNQNEFTNETR